MRARVSTLAAVLALSACGDDASGQTTDVATATGDSSSSDGTTTDDETTSTTDPDPTTSTTEPDPTEDTTTGPTVGCTPGDFCCNDDGQFEECYLDPESGLVWELVPGGGNPNVMDAALYCEQLTLLGASGWRLPTLDELRSLVWGCAETEAGGACELSEECPTQDCRNDACDGCIDTANMGPGMFGCYWSPDMQGECGRYWSSTDPGGGLGWLVDFDDATVRQATAALPAGLVRCVATLQ